MLALYWLGSNNKPSIFLLSDIWSDSCRMDKNAALLESTLNSKHTSFSKIVYFFKWFSSLHIKLTNYFLFQYKNYIIIGMDFEINIHHLCSKPFIKCNKKKRILLIHLKCFKRHMIWSSKIEKNLLFSFAYSCYITIFLTTVLWKYPWVNE